MFSLRSKVSLLGFAALAAATASQPAAARTVLEGPIPAQVMRVIDGDTVEVRALIWIGQEIVVRVRLAGVDTAELRAPCEQARNAALEAKAFVAREVEGAAVVLTRIHGDKYFGRVVGHILTPKGEDLSGLLLSAGLARPYQGRRRTAACAGE